MRVVEGALIAMGMHLLLVTAFGMVVFLRASGLADLYLEPLMSQLGVQRVLYPYLAVFLYYVLTVLAGELATIFAAFTTGYDNKNPRVSKGPGLQGLGSRLQAAHLNLSENIAPFAAAVVISALCKVPLDYRVHFSLIFLASRVVYIGFYALNLDLLRSLVYMVSLVCICLLFGLSFWPALVEGAMTATFQSVVVYSQPINDVLANLFSA